MQDVTDGDVFSDSTSRSHTIPLQADFLLAHSTCQDYYAWRHEANGSIFIQILCKCLNEFIPQGMDLMRILTRVSQIVARDFQSCTLDYATSGKKVMPSITSQLRFEVYFPARRLETTV
uniref:Caspase-7 n=1 Tax=Phallusia mammillata TaxID=59560 RepID=A0A6F9D8W9_9ASCI|nr:caspase-7 [Phallusia mammillata]